MTKLRVLDLFSGIGGFSLGLERAGGFETVAFCEIEPYCRKVLAKHWPNVPCYDDVRTLTADTLVRDGIAVDVICGGFPCQDLSFAGKRAGLSGERSGLWGEYRRLIGELRPRFVLAENVPGILSLGLGDVLGNLAALGYDACWECIPASAVGAPHRRDRWWLIAHPGSKQHQGDCATQRGASAQKLFAADATKDGRTRCDVWDNGRLSQAQSGDRVWLEPARNGASDGAPHLADASQAGLSNYQGRSAGTQRNGSGAVDGCGWSSGRHDNWSTEPAVGRVADGVPSRVDRLGALGNAVVPQIPELIGRAIMQAEGLA
jgi:DNA (cytosine-5)-methyltransferase 1